jgi:hypothetical protein
MPETPIDAAALERAETVLQVVYGQGVDRQLAALEIDREAWDSFLQQNWAILRGRYPDMTAAMDPRLEPAFNTIFTHCLMVGLVAGRDSVRRFD